MIATGFKSRLVYSVVLLGIILNIGLYIISTEVLETEKKPNAQEFFSVQQMEETFVIHPADNSDCVSIDADVALKSIVTVNSFCLKTSFVSPAVSRAPRRFISTFLDKVRNAGTVGSTLWSWSHESKPREIMDVLRDSFDYTNTKGQSGIGDDDSLSIAPSPSQDGTYVMRVFYKKGTFSSRGSCSKNEKCQTGAQFFAEPHALSGHTYTTLTLEYDVWFDETFEWNMGGKLPGLWGGSRRCSGGRISDDCFSTRLMWRSNGDGEVYAYVTREQQPSWSEFCNVNDNLSSSEKYKQIHCFSTFGIQIGTGSFRFETGRWHKLRQEVHLNSGPDAPGSIKLWVDGNAEVYVTNVIMRHSDAFGIDGLFFSTFYGGGDPTWACPRDTYTYYRNFRITTETQTPSMGQLV